MTPIVTQSRTGALATVCTSAMHRIAVPPLNKLATALLSAGEADTCAGVDPMTPIASDVDTAAALPPHLLRYERFPACTHPLVLTASEGALAIFRELVVGRSAS